MGRPLNKRFFASGVGATVGCFYHDGTSVVESAIISQKSNSQYRVAGGGGTPLTGTNITFADGDAFTMTTVGFADLTVTFAVGDKVRVASSENSGENDGVYTIATVNATVITITADGTLVVSAAPPDTAATLALVAPDGVIGTLVSGTPTALGEMQVVVSIDSLSDESAKIINAHQVKTFEGNTYTWPDTGGAGGSRAGILEADLQSTDL